MKTHDVAKALSQLARAMRAGPNVDLEQFDLALPIPPGFMRQRHIQDDLPVALAMLAELSLVPKQEWIRVVQEYGFPIDIRPRDASRDIVPKLAKYLEEHPEARHLLRRRAATSGGSVSPELARALHSLLEP